MKALLISILTFTILFAIAALIEKFTKHYNVAQFAEFCKDAFGIIASMLLFWFIYCLSC